jgi:hypothetical protein
MIGPRALMTVTAARLAEGCSAKTLVLQMTAIATIVA